MDRHRSRVAPCLAACVCALLAACGGGGYGGGSSMGSYSTPTPMTERYSAVLTGANETPPNPSAASGTAAVSVDTSTRMMTVSVSTTGITGTGAHVHEGAVGVAGPIIFPLTETTAGSGMWQTSVTLTDAQLTTLRNGGYYVNVHSAAYPLGEIRGQLKAY